MRQIFHKNFTTKIYNQKLKNHTCVNPNVNPKKYHIYIENGVLHIQSVNFNSKSNSLYSSHFI